MKGILVVNAFWKSASVEKMGALLCAAASRLGMRLSVRTNAQLLCALPPLRPLEEMDADFFIFWDKDIRLAMELEQLGYRVFNCARSIALCDDKTLTHLMLSKAGLPMPTTILCPQTFPKLGYPDTSFLSRVEEALGYPMVVKEGCGSFGQQVYLARQREEVQKIMAAGAGNPLLFQRFIGESAGQDIRLYMVGGRCVAAMRRVNNRDFRANIQIGGHAEEYAPTPEEISLAAEACRTLGLTFGGVDLLFGAGGPLLCEVNSNAHFTALSAFTHVDVAESILSHIQEVLCAAG